MDSGLIAGALAPYWVDRADSVAGALARFPRPAIRLRPGVDPADIPVPLTGVPWHPRGYLAPEGSRLGTTLSFAAGDFYIQDAASLLALTLLDARPGCWLCDLCAAPGGKSTGIVEELGQSGWLLANEVISSRGAVLEFNLARQGHARYVVAGADPEPLGVQLAGLFEAVLVDAPCSGQSLVSRGKQSESAFLPRTIEHCAARQTRILEAAAKLVRPGGRLVYATCTYAFDENEGQIDRFLTRHPEWSLQPVAAAGPWQSEHGAGHYRLWPDRHACQGGYAASLVRLSASEGQTATRTVRRTALHGPVAWPEGLDEWGILTDTVAYRSGERFFGLPTDVPSELVAIAGAGPEVAFRKGDTWFPGYGLALRRDRNWQPRQTITLDDRLASQYLEGRSISHDELGEAASAGGRGWAVVLWRGRPLGWVKGDGRQWKNHLPKPARLQAHLSALRPPPKQRD